jgi:hypothetical protein
MFKHILPMAALAAATPALATIPQSGGLYAFAYAMQGNAGEQRNSDLQFAEFDVPDQFASVSTSASDDPRLFTISYAQVVASWFSPDSGSVEMNWGWLSGNGGSGTLTSVAASTTWHYGFTPESNGWFSGNYDIALLGGDGIGIDPVLGGNDWGDFRVQNGTGSFHIPLLAGRRYDFFLQAGGYRQGADGLNAGADARALINWQIIGAPGAVPETASWAMLIIGFGLVGGAQRRRRRSPELFA